jgi:hypothetical protein
VKKFILQGFAPTAHLSVLEELFALPGLVRVYLCVAFANTGGVALIQGLLHKHAKKVVAYIGIRNSVTTREGLSLLLNTGIDLYAVDTGSISTVFHPKLYMARGDKAATLVVGSANLTRGGLNRNIEASVITELNLAVKEDANLTGEIEQQLDDLPAAYPNHVFRIISAAQLNKLQKQGRLLDEAAAAGARSVTGFAVTDPDDIARIKLKVKSLPKQVIPTSVKAKAAPLPTQTSAPPLAANYQLVWESKPLSKSDLNIPQGAGTNLKGSMSLDKGLLSDEIDHRHYFRDDVFAALVWTKSNIKTVDEAHAAFEFVLRGVLIGTFTLRIAHTISVTSKTYMQHNAMTRLNWGDIKPYIQSTSLLERTLRLFRDANDAKRFRILID